MSIIERALQKAQQGRASANLPRPVGASPTGAVAEPALQPPDHAAEPLGPLDRPPAVDAGIPGNASPADLMVPSFTERDLTRIVEVDCDRLRSVGRMPPVHAAHQTEEEMRRIKWPLLGTIAGRGGSAPARNNVILVTSAEPA